VCTGIVLLAPYYWEPAPKDDGAHARGASADKRIDQALAWRGFLSRLWLRESRSRPLSDCHGGKLRQEPWTNRDVDLGGVLPTSGRRCSRGSSRHRRRSLPSTRPRLKNGGQSSRLQTLGRIEAACTISQPAMTAIGTNRSMTDGQRRSTLPGYIRHQPVLLSRARRRPRYRDSVRCSRFRVAEQ
jgi:hypothetical protein